MADKKNSAKLDIQDSSSPPLEQENHPQANGNDTLLRTHSIKDVQENDSVHSDTRKHQESTLHGMTLGPPDEDAPKCVALEAAEEDDNGRERLKRHRVEVAGRVWIPDIWGQEDLLKDWIDCSVFEASLASSGIMSARAALVDEGS